MRFIPDENAQFRTVFLLDAEIPSVNRGVRNAQLVGDTGSATILVVIRFVLREVLGTPNWRLPSATVDGTPGRTRHSHPKSDKDGLMPMQLLCAGFANFTGKSTDLLGPLSTELHTD
eukprot:s37_g19.t1